jgi:excisionase family DNA binding protein
MARTMTTGDVAAALNVSQQTVVNWERVGKLTCSVTGGGHRRFDPEEVAALRVTLPSARPLRRGRPVGKRW